MTIGFIYVGPKTDYGYNQAHAEGAAVIAKLPGVKIREEEKVPETSAVQKTMESMINLDGATLLFPTSFGYFDPHILKEAEKYPNVTFLHCGGLYDEGKHPDQRGQLLRLHRRGPVRRGHRRRADDQDQQARLHRRQADPAGAAQHQRLHAGRALGEPQGHHHRHLHRRLVDAGQGGRGRQQPDRSGRRRADHARRLAQGHRRDRREARHLRHRLPRQPVGARAQGLPDRRRVELGQGLHRLRRHGMQTGKP